jgi:flagellum-specific ATP synthase
LLNVPLALSQAIRGTFQLRALTADIEAIDEVEVFGRVKTVQGLLIEVVGPVRELRVGGRVQIESTGGEHLEAEIIGFRDGHALCLPFGPLAGVRLGCKAVFQRNDGAVYPTDGWLGRVVNANGEPIDGKGPLPRGVASYPLKQQALPAHARARVGAPIDMGVRVMNTFTTMCEGQRMGIFAGSGVG